MPAPRVSPLRPRDVWPHWKVLCEQIGERRAGSPKEYRAAAYIEKIFAEAGLAHTRSEAFTCSSLRSAKSKLQVKVGNRWQNAKCEVLVNSPSTPGHTLREYPLVWLEMPEQRARLTPGSLKGKALLLFGPLSTDTAGHKQLVKSGAELVLWVDDRFPHPWSKSDAILPHWVRHYGARPTLAVGFRDAYDWRLKGVARVRGMVQTVHAERASYNVVGELPGADPKAKLITLGCHYDTQVGNSGADDNGSGTVALLAWAKTFARAAQRKPFRHTIRFVAFGTEEQLSVGSGAYAVAHRKEMKRHRIMFNFDSFASALGHSEMLVAGRPSLEKWAVRSMNKAGVPVRVRHDVTPFADHFPFNIYGVPSLWFARSTFPGGRWQHHSPHDNLGTVSAERLCEVANAAAGLITACADAKKLPFEPGLPPADRPLIRTFARELFDLRV